MSCLIVGQPNTKIIYRYIQHTCKTNNLIQNTYYISVNRSNKANALICLRSASLVKQNPLLDEFDERTITRLSGLVHRSRLSNLAMSIKAFTARFNKRVWTVL